MGEAAKHVLQGVRILDWQEFEDFSKTPLTEEEVAIVRGVEQLFQRAITSRRGKRPECAGCLQEFSEEVGPAGLLVIEGEQQKLSISPICRACAALGHQAAFEKILISAIELEVKKANRFYVGGEA